MKLITLLTLSANAGALVGLYLETGEIASPLIPNIQAEVLTGLVVLNTLALVLTTTRKVSR